jgi:hypothetical protein
MIDWMGNGSLPAVLCWRCVAIDEELVRYLLHVHVGLYANLNGFFPLGIEHDSKESCSWIFTQTNSFVKKKKV